MTNEEKNTYVKQQITVALLALLDEKPMEEISVSELTQRAQVGRVSFYRNFASKADVLEQESRRLLQQWGGLFGSKPSGEYDSYFLSLFDFLKEHGDFYTTLHRCGQSEIIMNTIVASADIAGAAGNLEAYLKSFWAYGIYGWIIEWINRGMQESGEELFLLFQNAQNAL